MGPEPEDLNKNNVTYCEDPRESRPNLTDSSTKNCKYKTVEQIVITTIIPRCYTQKGDVTLILIINVDVQGHSLLHASQICCRL